MKKMDGKWVIAVSGGADSMALLDMCFQQHMDIYVAHVNYQKRESAIQETKEVEAYCIDKDISCYVHYVEHYEEGYNFQAQARDIRYHFFQKIIALVDAQGVLVAHHFDDVLETYLLQIERGSTPAYYGMKEDAYVHDVFVKRPLLSYGKKQLVNYCKEHHIVYFDDESNFEDTYRRNAIRHHVLSAYTDMQKQELIEEMVEKNKQNEHNQNQIQQYVQQMHDQFTLVWFYDIPTSLQSGVIREWLVKQGVSYHISEKNIVSFLQLIHDNKENFKHTINGHYYLQVAYNHVHLHTNTKDSFAYVFDTLPSVCTPYFYCQNKGRAIEGLTLHEDDFPITIRSVQNGDTIQLRIGNKKVSRFLIDNKISHKERQIWPLVVNRKGNVIFVCGIGCDIEHYSNNPNLFVLK